MIECLVKNTCTIQRNCKLSLLAVKAFVFVDAWLSQGEREFLETLLVMYECCYIWNIGCTSLSVTSQSSVWLHSYLVIFFFLSFKCWLLPFTFLHPNLWSSYTHRYMLHLRCLSTLLSLSLYPSMLFIDTLHSLTLWLSVVFFLGRGDFSRNHLNKKSYWQLMG